jgi:tRNA(fMet)-specific endonuclease VapC
MLDSNVCIYLLKGLSTVARERIERCVPGEVVASAIAYAEVMRGIDPSDRQATAAARAFFTTCPVLPFDAAAAGAYRDIPFRRRRFDRLIGAHALAAGLTIVTNDEADFADIPGLTIENWTR